MHFAKEKRCEGVIVAKNGNAGLVKTVVRGIIVLGVCAAVVAVVFAVKDMTENAGQPEITGTFVSEKLEDCSELSSAELTYRGMVSFQDGDIPFLTQKAFQMLYTAEIRAGVDLGQAQVSVSDAELRIDLPAVEVQTLTILPDSLEVIDQQRALLNWTNREDMVTAMQYAEDDAREHADIEGLKTRAGEQTKRLINGLFEGFIGDRMLVVEFALAEEEPVTDEEPATNEEPIADEVAS